MASPHSLRKGTIPLPNSPFLGREKEVKQLIQLLEEHNLVTITGTGGIGKTRIAIEICHRIKTKIPADIIFVSQQLAAMIESALKIPGFEVGWEPKEARVAKSGDLGYVIAHKYLKVPDESGNFQTLNFIELGIWEKQIDGTWKNTIDFYNPHPSINSIKTLID